MSESEKYILAADVVKKENWRIGKVLNEIDAERR